jgi:hypothetical protein
VQTGGDRTVGVTGDEGAYRLPDNHRLSYVDNRRDGFVGGPESIGVVDAHDTGTGDGAGERDHAGAGREHRLARGTGEVDPAVPGQPRPRRWLERPGYPGMPGQRPAEATGRRTAHRPLGRPRRGPGHVEPSHRPNQRRRPGPIAPGARRDAGRYSGRNRPGRFSGRNRPGRFSGRCRPGRAQRADQEQGREDPQASSDHARQPGGRTPAQQARPHRSVDGEGTCGQARAQDEPGKPPP